MRFEICLLNMLWMVGFLDMEGRDEILFFSTMAWMGWTLLRMWSAGMFVQVGRPWMSLNWALASAAI